MIATGTTRPFRDGVYNAVGRGLGYVIAPLSLVGLGLPVVLFASRSVQLWLGGIFAAVAVLGLAGNVYLGLRRMVVRHSASSFPLIVSMAGIPAVIVLEGALTLRALVVGVGILVVDLLGPMCVVLVLGKRRGGDSRSSGARPN